MNISDQSGFTFRQLVYDGEVTFEELWLAFWSGKFEYRGKSRVTIELPPNVRPATRDLLIHIYPDGRWVPSAGQDAKEREAHWSSFAAVPMHEINGTWLKNTFGRILISREVFDAWQTVKADEIGQRTLRVLKKAAGIRQDNPGISDRVLAKRILGGKTTYALYHEPTIRKIVAGQYLPAMTRGLPSLNTWMQRNL